MSLPICWRTRGSPSQSFRRRYKPRFGKSIPAYGSAGNPVDVTTDWPRFSQMYGETLNALMASDEVDAVVPVLLQRSALMPEVTMRIIAEQQSARDAGIRKPIHVCWVGPEGAEENRRRLLSAGIPCHPWTVRTAGVVAKSQVLPIHAKPCAGPPMPMPATTDAEGWVDPETTFRLLAAAGVSFATWRIADGANAVVAARRRWLSLRPQGHPTCASAQERSRCRENRHRGCGTDA